MIIVFIWGRELDIVGSNEFFVLLVSIVLNSIEEVCWLDQPLPGAHSLSDLLLEVLNDDLKVLEEEHS